MSFKPKTTFLYFLLFSCVPLTSSAEVFGPGYLYTLLIAGPITTTGVAGGIYTTTSQDKPASIQQVLDFLRQNKTDFRIAVQLGSGEVLDDFSRLLGFTDDRTNEIAQLLRKNRKFVNEKTMTQLSEENVEILLSWINQKIASVA